MIRTASILLLLIICNPVSGQQFNRYGNADTVKIIALKKLKYLADESAIKGDSLLLETDSVSTMIHHFDKKIETTSFFFNNKSRLNISFYFDDCHLLMTDIKEQSPLYEDLNAITILFYENDTVFFTDHYFMIPSCMTIPINKSVYELFGYNPKLKGDFLKQYVWRLYLGIKKRRITTMLNL